MKTWLAVVRLIRGLDQQRLADAAGLSRVEVSRLENGERHPRWTTARALAKALDVSPEILFPDEGAASPLEVLTKHLGI